MLQIGFIGVMGDGASFKLADQGTFLSVMTLDPFIILFSQTTQE
jgi:hypothetical protein